VEQTIKDSDHQLVRNKLCEKEDQGCEPLLCNERI